MKYILEGFCTRGRHLLIEDLYVGLKHLRLEVINLPLEDICVGGKKLHRS